MREARFRCPDVRCAVPDLLEQDVPGFAAEGADIGDGRLRLLWRLGHKNACRAAAEALDYDPIRTRLGEMCIHVGLDRKSAGHPGPLDVQEDRHDVWIAGHRLAFPEAQRVGCGGFLVFCKPALA